MAYKLDEDKPCPVCGVQLSRHPQCGYCLILVGPTHFEESLDGQIKGKPICASCRDVYRKYPQSLRPSSY